MLRIPGWRRNGVIAVSDINHAVGLFFQGAKEEHSSIKYRLVSESRQFETSNVALKRNTPIEAQSSISVIISYSYKKPPVNKLKKKAPKRIYPVEKNENPETAF